MIYTATVVLAVTALCYGLYIYFLIKPNLEDEQAIQSSIMGEKQKLTELLHSWQKENDELNILKGDYIQTETDIGQFTKKQVWLQDRKVELEEEYKNIKQHILTEVAALQHYRNKEEN